MSEDLLAKLQVLLGDDDLAAQLHGLLGGGGMPDVGVLAAGLQANPGLLEAVKAKLGDNPLAALSGVFPGGAGAPDLGPLAGLVPGSGAAGSPEPGGLGQALGGLLGGEKKA